MKRCLFISMLVVGIAALAAILIYSLRHRDPLFHGNPTILLVEDNEDDVFAMRRALRLDDIVNPLEVVADGLQAIDYLSGAGAFSDRQRWPLPFIIFLDLKLPYVDGFEVLDWIRAQPALASTVVIVLTGSAESRDRERAYNLGARSYLIKPPKPEALRDVCDSLGNYWLSTRPISPVQRAARGKHS